ncbi:MAG: methyltransferase domain-containing protein, partial [Mesorhizobium sp.]|nr:methyltransferase domain-containing protein [Mesorhizobium sp.]
MTEDKKVEAEFDSYSDAYDQAVNESIAFSGLKVDFFAAVKASYLLDIITAHHGSSRQAAVLDIGCGIGNYHPLLIDRVGSISGTDVSDSSLAEARRRNPHVDYRYYTGTILPYEDHTFDVAFT